MVRFGHVFVCLLALCYVSKPLLAQAKQATLAQPKDKKDLKSVEDKGLSKAMDKLFARWDKPDSPGVAVAVTKGGKIVFKKGYGIANLEYSVPVTPKTVFHIASVSKQFTTFSILLLAEKKKLSLDDDIRKHIPEVPDFGSKITLRHLAHHTSGLRDQWSLLMMAGWRMDDVITRKQIMRLVENQTELNFTPGEKFVYCNTGYTLLAEVVARVSGQSFADFTKQNIFEPLGMKDTLFYDDHEKIVKNRAYSYKRKNGKLVKSVLSYANVGATSLFTTAEDLTKWAINFEEPKVGNRKVIELMNVKGSLNNDKQLDYALGQLVTKYRGLNTIGHGGADAGYRSNIARYPEQRFSVVLLSNDASFRAGPLANQVVDIFLKGELDEKPPLPKEIKVKPEILKKYVATFQLRPGLDLAITEKDGVLYARGTGQSRFTLTAISETDFVFRPAGIKVAFKFDKEKKLPIMTYKQRGFTRVVDPSTRFDSKSVKFTDFEGEYHSPELSTEYRFVIEKDKLVMKHSRHNDSVATFLDQDKIRVSPLGNVEFIRNEKNAVIGMKASTGRVLNLKFDKR